MSHKEDCPCAVCKKIRYARQQELRKVWLSAWCATASAANCSSKETAANWADMCVAHYKARFK